VSAGASAERIAEMSASVRPAVSVPSGGGVSDSSLLADLLHQLIQPLTGLQCSLELALVGQRTAEQYQRAIGQGLELVARMRMLAEALREVIDIAQKVPAPAEAIALDALLRATVDDLRPVAESRAIRMDVNGNPFPHLCAVRGDVATALFRLFESALNLAEGQSVLSVRLKAQPQQAGITIAWIEKNGGVERAPFSPPELGLLVARATWQGAGGEWGSDIFQRIHTVNLLLPWAVADKQPVPPDCGDLS
jgi:signal transduction histidine kinase